MHSISLTGKGNNDTIQLMNNRSNHEFWSNFELEHIRIIDLTGMCRIDSLRTKEEPKRQKWVILSNHQPPPLFWRWGFFFFPIPRPVSMPRAASSQAVPAMAASSPRAVSQALAARVVSRPKNEKSPVNPKIELGFVWVVITGHKTLQMLKRYTHLRAADLARKIG